MSKKGVPRQNINSSKKCPKKGAVSKKGGVQKRGNTGVTDFLIGILEVLSQSTNFEIVQSKSEPPLEGQVINQTDG